jgi:large subunit ribosomal protein L5
MNKEQRSIVSWKIKNILKLSNIHQTPKLEKVIVAIGIWSLATRKGVKDFSEIEKNLQKITWQKPHYTYSKKAISNFKLREGMHSMVKVTLRWEKAEMFLSKLSSVVLTRHRDYLGLSKKGFDWRSWYSFWLKSISSFPELHPDDISTDIGLQITICTTAWEPSWVKAYLEVLWFVFS